jgi:hypothetical protein
MKKKKRRRSRKNDGFPPRIMTKSGKLLINAAMAYAARKMTSLKVNRPFSESGNKILKVYGNHDMGLSMPEYRGRSE